MKRRRRLQGTQLWFFEVVQSVRYRLGRGFVVAPKHCAGGKDCWVVCRESVQVAESWSLDDALAAIQSLEPSALDTMAAEVWCETCETWRAYKDRGHLFCSERCKELHERAKENAKNV